MDKQIKIIAFSKNRPVQLFALIESFFRHCADADFADFVVLYKSDPEYAETYKDVLSLVPKSVRTIEEGNFQKDLTRELIFSRSEYSMFLVDDIVFKAAFSLSNCLSVLLKNSECLSFSLRLGRGLDACYSCSCAQREPSFTQEGEILVFNHVNEGGDYGYPISLDGNIFRAKEFNDLCYRIDFRFSSPNTLESALSAISKHSYLPNTACFIEPKLFNIPDNIVNTDIRNRNEQNDPARFLRIWNDGRKIDIWKFAGVKNTSCHFPMEYEYVRR